jgi:trehalose 6-phosphate phosphatase
MHGLPFSPDRAALFLDFDGTLVEIAPRPEAVTVPPSLPPLLERLSRRLDGALAVVSGRPVAQLDLHLPVPIAKVGDHGAALRAGSGGPVSAPQLPVPPQTWRDQAEAVAAAFPGALVEHKTHGLVIHYRLAPEASEAAHRLLTTLVEGDEAFTLMPARMAWEVKPRAVSKGTAVATLLAQPPFAGRLPVFVGDDVTDEAGMAAAEAAGGIGLKLQDAFGTPAAFRDWLAQMDGLLADGARTEAGAR